MTSGEALRMCYSPIAPIADAQAPCPTLRMVDDVSRIEFDETSKTHLSRHQDLYFRFFSRSRYIQT